MRSSPPRSVAASGTAAKEKHKAAAVLPQQQLQQQNQIFQVLFYLITFGIGLSVGAILTSPETYNTHVHASSDSSVKPTSTDVRRATIIPATAARISPPLPQLPNDRTKDEHGDMPSRPTTTEPRPPVIKKTPQSLPPLDHGMTDEELLWRSSMVPKSKLWPYGSRRVPKVAFLFLTRGELPFAPLWDKFFRRADPRLYSVYIHSDPSFNWSAVNANPPEDAQGSVFFQRRIPSKAVEWGKLSMVDAERRLLANALLDPSNERFVLLSEACIPLHDFATVYSHLINSTTTFIDSYDDPGQTGRGRYSSKMSPTIPLARWRKGSQWFEADRRLALAIVADTRFYEVFRDHCRRCYPDEHYIPTLVASTPALAVRNGNRSVTWVDWSRAGPHPGRFWRGQVTPEFLRRLREGDGGECDYRGRRTKVCFLFARKFLPNSLDRLMRFSQKAMGF